MMTFPFVFVFFSFLILCVCVRLKYFNGWFRNSFGANHDGPTNGCEPLSGDQHVMSPQLGSDAGPIVWSNCSRKDITRFLDRNWGSCLEDPPSDHEFHYPELPPGAMYNVDHQCRLQYGPETTHCAGMDEVRDIIVS